MVGDWKVLLDFMEQSDVKVLFLKNVFMAIILLYSIYVVKLTINMSNLHHVYCFLLVHLWVVALFIYCKYLKAQS